MILGRGLGAQRAGLHPAQPGAGHREAVGFLSKYMCIHRYKQNGLERDRWGQR